MKSKTQTLTPTGPQIETPSPTETVTLPQVQTATKP